MLQRQTVSFCVSQNIIAATHHFYKRLYYMPAFFSSENNADYYVLQIYAYEA